jgi:nucleotidyltransferase/DNA polymerase involved in DNA repair
MDVAHSRVILHLDMDAFFASIEQRDNPAFRGKPVIVGAKPGNRGVVCAASYEARVFGVHSAQPINQAYADCPQGIFVTPRMRVYAEESREIMALIGSFSPVVEQLSIDEAFVDITGTRRLWGAPHETAAAMQKLIYDKRRLTVSVGVAPNKFLAKIASDMNKPNGITLTPFGETEIAAWLGKLSVGKLIGVGKKTQELFFAHGVRTIGDAQKMSREHLLAAFGKHGEDIFSLCRGIDTREVVPSGDRQSVSREHTFNEDEAGEIVWKKTLLTLSRDVALRLRTEGQRGTTVVLIYRGRDFTKHTRRKTLFEPTATVKTIYGEAVNLLAQAGLEGKLLRLIGVGVTGLVDDIQTSMFHDAQAWEASERAMDALSKKFGKHIIVRGAELQH